MFASIICGRRIPSWCPFLDGGWVYPASEKPHGVSTGVIDVADYYSRNTGLTVFALAPSDLEIPSFDYNLGLEAVAVDKGVSPSFR